MAKGIFLPTFFSAAVLFYSAFFPLLERSHPSVGKSPSIAAWMQIKFFSDVPIVNVWELLGLNFIIRYAIETLFYKTKELAFF